MKVLEFHSGKKEDYLWFHFESTFDPRSALERELEPFLQALEGHGNGWMPDVINGKRRRKYSRTSFWKALEERRDENSTGMGLYREAWPALDMTFRLYFPPLSPDLDVTIKVKPLSFFSEAEHCRHLVEMVHAWAMHYPVSHAVAHSSDDGALAGAPLFGRDMQTSIRDGFDKIYEVSWLNVFGPKLVESVGRERVLSTPAHRVEELPNGAVLLVPWPTLADFASDEAREAQARAHAHLRPDLDLDTLRRSLRERSAQLVPVEPRFHPDVAPLLSRVADATASHARPRTISAFNASPPPEPDEWLSPSEAMASDEEAPESLLSQYGELADNLVVILHAYVPSIFKYTLEALTDADFYFWREDYPKTRMHHVLDELVVPAVGAYLGQVLVNELGGKWLPCSTLEESRVLVGRRVWRPMVRASRYLRSQQSLLDYSLTQLYRAAERHRD